MTQDAHDKWTVAELLKALETNFVVHVSWVPRRIPGSHVVDDPRYLLVDSGLATDTFNVVTRARIASDPSEVTRVIDYFARVARPFSWWVGPFDEPERMRVVLGGYGLVEADRETAMALRLDDLVERRAPGGLRVERVRTREQLADFGRIAAANWDPPDSDVERFYGRAGSVLDETAPVRLFVGYVGHEPVAVSELCMAGGVAGLYVVSTLREHRRKGFGYALSAAPLIDARREGIRFGVLQASGDGERVYSQMGFNPIGSYTEYQPVA